MNPGSFNGSGNIFVSNFWSPTSGFYTTENWRCDVDGLPACSQNDYLQSAKLELQGNLNSDFWTRSLQDCYRNSGGSVLSFMQKPGEESSCSLKNQGPKDVSFSEYQNNNQVEVGCHSFNCQILKPSSHLQLPDQKQLPTDTSLVPSAVASKKRIRWTEDLHNRFIECVDLFGGAERATPKGILKLMETKELTIFHVKSHLQKYRMERHIPESAEEACSLWKP